MLQLIGDENAVSTLYNTALQRFTYLDYDNAFGLARKCTWALADIGSPEAKNAFLKLASHPEPLIAGYAQRRLDHREEELNRKKYSG